MVSLLRMANICRKSADDRRSARINYFPAQN
jgi:hypothetical protein